MSDMLSDDPLLVNQIFDKPLDMGFDYDGDTSFDDFFANLNHDFYDQVETARYESRKT